MTVCWPLTAMIIPYFSIKVLTHSAYLPMINNNSDHDNNNNNNNNNNMDGIIKKLAKMLNNSLNTAHSAQFYFGLTLLTKSQRYPKSCSFHMRKLCYIPIIVILYQPVPVQFLFVLITLNLNTVTHYTALFRNLK